MIANSEVVVKHAVTATTDDRGEEQGARWTAHRQSGWRRATREWAGAGRRSWSGSRRTCPCCTSGWTGCASTRAHGSRERSGRTAAPGRRCWTATRWWRSEEHTSELQSRRDLVCRLLLE